MKTKHWLVFWQLRFVVFLTTIWLNSFTGKALAQSTPSNIQADETLGTESSQIIQNFQQPREVITGGATRGINLFHSFREFNVSEGREAYFFSPSAGIQNILARVTGGNRSEILGTLGTVSNSQLNLFLINPNGIIFGENASLDLQGSFVATTANELQFGNQGLFSATNPQAPALLTINPSAFLFNQLNRNTGIQNNSIASAQEDPVGLDALGLRVAAGKSLLLVGGNITMDGGSLFTLGGRVELGGLAEPGRIALDVNGDNLSLKFPDNVTRGDISLTHQATVFVLGAGGGNIAINARHIDILETSSIFAGILPGLGTPDTVAGDITLDATEQVKVGQGSEIRNAVLTNAIGKGGDLTIRTKDLLVQDGAQLSVRTSSAGKGGNLNVNAFNKVELIGRSVDGRASSGLFVSTNSPKIGDAGDLRITTKDLLVRDGAQINAATFGAGKGGNLTVNASNSIQLISNSADGSFISALAAYAERSSTGNAGNLTITTKDLLVRDGAKIGADTFGAGKGGDLTVNASNQVEVIGKSLNGRAVSSLSAQANSGSTGDGGNVTITTQDLVLKDGAQVGAGTFGTGKGGDLTIATQNLLIQGGAQVSAGTFGAGKGGNLTVNASNKVEVIGSSSNGRVDSGIYAQANSVSTGDAGDLKINTQSLTVRDGAQVSTATLGRGKGGNLSVNASNKVEVIGRSTDGRATSRLFTSTDIRSTKNGGDLTIKTQDLVVRDGAQLSTDTFGTGKGGNITVNAETLLVRDGAQVGAITFGAGKGGNITVNTSQNFEMIGTPTVSIFPPSRLRAGVEVGSIGNGGDVTINTRNLLLKDGAQIGTATFGEGNAGNLTVNATDSVQLIGMSSDGFSLSSLNASASAVGSKGNAGNLIVNTPYLLLRDGARVRSSTFGRGKGGNLTVNATNKVEVIGVSANTLFPSGIFASSQPGETGDAGNLTIYTQNLLVRDGAQVNAGTFGQGNGGNLTVNAANSVELIGTYFNDLIDTASGLYTQADASSTGNGGELIVNTQNLFVRDGARVSTSTLGSGNGGNLTINASNVQLIGTDANGTSISGLFSSIQGNSTKSAGNLIVNAQDLIVRDGAQVSAGTYGTGHSKGGNLTINAFNSVQVIGTSNNKVQIFGDDSRRVPTSLSSQAARSTTGDAGDLTINTQNLLVRDGGQIDVSTFGTGKAGNLTVNASNSVQIIGESADSQYLTGLFASTERRLSGNAGDLTINTRQLLVRDRAGIFVNSRGTGNAGIMTINADTIRLDNQASLNANTRSPNKDPNREQATINLNTQNLTLRRNSSITTNASGENVIGGNININTKFLIAPENSRISANSDNFRGGRVRINAQGVFVGNKLSDVSNYITATSGVGLSGSVDVNSPDNSSLQNSLTELSQNLIDTNALLANSCIVRSQEKQQSSFTITGTGGLPNRPGDASMSNYSTGDIRNITNENTSLHWKKGDPIIEPQGVYRLSDGKLVMSRECQND